MRKLMFIGLFSLCGCTADEEPKVGYDAGAATDSGHATIDEGMAGDAQVSAPSVVVPPEVEFEYSGTIPVALSSAPVGPVEISVSLESTLLQLSTSFLRFDVGNWDVPQSVEVFLDADSCPIAPTLGTATFEIDGGDGSVAEVGLTSTVRFTPDVSLDRTAVTVVEDGTTADVVVTLSGCIGSGETVRIPAVPSDDDITVDPGELTFTRNEMSRTLTIGAVDDSCIEPLRSPSVALGPATGGAFEGLEVGEVAVTVVDNDSPSITIVPSIVQTSESGTTATFDVHFGVSPDCTPPVAYIEVTASQPPPDEGAISQVVQRTDASSGFGPMTFTVTGLDDFTCDGDQTYAIDLTVASDDPAYDGLSVPSVAVVNVDDDMGVNVQPSSVMVPEAGSAVVEVSLGCDPSGTLSLDFGSSMPSELTISPVTMSFDSTNFAAPQPLTLSGVPENVTDGNHAVSVDAVVTSGQFRNVFVPSIQALVVDDD